MLIAYEEIIRGFSNKDNNQRFNIMKLDAEIAELSKNILDIYNDQTDYCNKNTYDEALQRSLYFYTLKDKDFVHQKYVKILISSNNELLIFLEKNCNFNKA